MNKLQQVFDDLESQYFSLVESLETRVINEVVDLSGFDKGGDFSDINDKLEKLSFMFDASRRGLGIVNRLKPGEYRAKHAHQIMVNLNKIRGRLQALTRELAETI